jgi:hypothetical protein
MTIKKQNFSWGFTKSSEKINGRFAMIGLIIIFLIELLTKQSLLSFI